MEPPNGVWAQSHGVRKALVYLHYSYPIILLVVFLLGVMIYSIATASKEVATSAPIQTGPGGKPLPKNKKTKKAKAKEPEEFSAVARGLFNWLTVGVILTFLADAALVCLHALIDRKENWWCGKPVAVRSFHRYAIVRN